MAERLFAETRTKRSPSAIVLGLIVVGLPVNLPVKARCSALGALPSPPHDAAGT